MVLSALELERTSNRIYLKYIFGLFNAIFLIS